MEISKDSTANIKIEHYDTPKFKNILKMNMITNKIHNYIKIDKDKQTKFKPYQLKVICNIHNNKFMYKCEYPDCKEPYICPHQQCIEQHFHNNQSVVMSKFDISIFKEKYQRMQQSILNHENLNKNAMRIKNTIDHFKTSVISLSKDIVVMNSIIDDIRSQVDNSLTNNFIEKIDEALLMEKKIINSIEVFKSQLILNSPTLENGFFMKNEIVQFLEVNIPNFHWNSVTTVFNSNKKKGCDVKTFHQTLQKKKNLVFLLIAKKQVICTYISTCYPSLNNKLKDDSSFVIVASQSSGTKKLSKYIANPDLEYHFSVEDSSYINHGYSSEYGDGILISKEDLLHIQCKLPSLSFAAENVIENHDICNKLQQILIVQSETVIE